MKEIPLTQGKFAKIDDEDYERTSIYNWSILKSVHKSGTNYYAVRGIKVNGKNYLVKLHNFIIGIIPENMEVDHKNRDSLDNQKNNLRICTRTQNVINVRKRQGTSSQYKGVQWVKSMRKWRVMISINKKNTLVGDFKIEVDAAIAYNNAALKYFGEFAYINIIK